MSETIVDQTNEDPFKKLAEPLKSEFERGQKINPDFAITYLVLLNGVPDELILQKAELRSLV